MNSIADAKTKYFTNKSHYLSARAAWARAANDSSVKLEAYHFMFYNAIRGKDITEGFTTPGLKTLFYQRWVNLASYEARRTLSMMLSSRFYKSKFDDLCSIFGETLSPETIQQVIRDMPEIKQQLLTPVGPFECWAKQYIEQEIA